MAQHVWDKHAGSSLAAAMTAKYTQGKLTASRRSVHEQPEAVQQRPQDPKQVVLAAATELAGANPRAANSASSSSGAVALPNFLVVLAHLQMELGQSHRTD